MASELTHVTGAEVFIFETGVVQLRLHTERAKYKKIVTLAQERHFRTIDRRFSVRKINYQTNKAAVYDHDLQKYMESPVIFK